MHRILSPPHLAAITLLLGAVALLSCSEATPEEPLSVLLVTPDSLRIDRLRPWNPDAAPVPNVERLAASGTLYRNAWATAPWTAPSIVSVMTGLTPPAHGVAYRDDTTPPSLDTLPKLLAERGYEIGNFSFFSQISYFRNLGLGPTRKGLRHDRVAGAFSEWLAGLPAEQPFFAWTHLLETHLPYGATGYRAPAAAVAGSEGLEAAQMQGTVPFGGAAFVDGDQERLTELYDRDVIAMDGALGTMLDALERADRLDSTVVVFVADHGEELLDGPLDPPWVGHASTSQLARLIPDILRVPLIVAGPGFGRGVSSDRLVQQNDVLPRLRDLLELPSGPSDGFPLPTADESLGERLGAWLSRRPQRRFAWFDSSPGGNLTPPGERGVRLQGVTDGRCLLAEQLSAAATVTSTIDLGLLPVDLSVDLDTCDRRGLERSLERWRARQARLRLRLLGGGAQPPPLDDADQWRERITWRAPSDDRLDWQRTRGQITLAWDTGDESNPSAGEDVPRRRKRPPASVWLQYEFLGGSGILGAALDLDGQFEIDQNPITFGPIPPGFWADVAAYSPVRVRILDPAKQLRSAWREVEVLEPGG